MPTLRKPKFGPDKIIILFVIGLAGLIVVTGNYKRILETLFSPTAVLIMVIMLFEYLLLKGADRTHIYRRELDATRHKRREDVLALSEMERELAAIHAKLETTLLQHGKELDHESHDVLLYARDATKNLHNKIRERI